jgi:hypothetical protein
MGSDCWDCTCSRPRSCKRKSRSTRRPRTSTASRSITARTTPNWIGWCGARRWRPTRPTFEKLIAPAYQWLNETPERVPLTDWYDTKTGKQQGFQARSVVGGIFIKMLSDPAMWSKYSQRARKLRHSLWGSQSWLQPAFSRLSSVTRVNALRSRITSGYQYPRRNSALSNRFKIVRVTSGCEHDACSNAWKVLPESGGESNALARKPQHCNRQ